MNNSKNMFFKTCLLTLSNVSMFSKLFLHQQRIMARTLKHIAKDSITHVLVIFRNCSLHFMFCYVLLLFCYSLLFFVFLV